jgi:hypothetical protein
MATVQSSPQRTVPAESYDRAQHPSLDNDLVEHFGLRSVHNPNDYICRVCHRVYKRQDARRKHEWQKHALPDAKPHTRRRADPEFSQ